MVWTFRAYDLRTGTFLTELPVTAWWSHHPVKGSGRWTATIPLNPSRTHTVTGAPTVEVSDTTLTSATVKGRTAVVPFRDGVPVHGFTGLVHDRRYDSTTRAWTLAGAGLGSYFDLFIQRLAPTYNGVDQFTIFRDFIDQVQTNTTGGDIGIQVDADTSGVLRDRIDHYKPYSGNTWGQLMRNLAAVIDGFDFDFRTELNTGTLGRWCRLWYPRRGRSFESTALTFRLPASGSGGNVRSYELRESVEQMAVEVFALGAGDGEDMRVVSFAATELIDAGFPGYTTQRSWKDVRDLNTLEEHARGVVSRLSGVDSEVYRLTVDPDFRMRPFGSWDLGDDCQFVIEDDPRTPAVADGTPGSVSARRVLAHTWTVQAGKESLTVDIGQRWKAS